MEWLEEHIPYVDKGNWLYKIICFFLGKRKSKMTYKELYLFLSRLNEDAMGQEKSKEAALIRVIQIYKHLHNGNLPEEVENLNNGQ